jgi:uncharacterized SAM-binding protein YcdF (DUF218 family)
MRALRRVVVVLVVAAIAYPALLGYLIWEQSHHDELHSADAIVVFGAAQYDGKPSPVFKARLDHAAYLYRQGFSKTIVVTGGKQPGDRFTEAEAGRRYLSAEGIPAERILEGAGDTTLGNLESVKRLATGQGIRSLLLVSDPLHSERIKMMAGDLGFDDSYASPDSYLDLKRSRLTKAKELVHEIASLLAYQILRR